MHHFSLEQWADYVRNALGYKDKAAMQAHLETGCKRCSTALNTWTRVLDAAARERAYEPPESAVRTVKALGAIHVRPRRVPVARLLFDSLLSPAFAGVRSAGAAPRQMLYGVGDYRIDMRIEPSADALALTGQVLISADPARPVRDVTVKLTKGRETLAISRTNEFGEFDLECKVSGDLHLELSIPKGAFLDILVPQRPGTGTGTADKSRGIDSKGVRGRKSRRPLSPRKKG